jgi:hypothetical protein
MLRYDATAVDLRGGALGVVEAEPREVGKM